MWATRVVHLVPVLSPRRKEPHHVPSSEVLAGRWGATRSAPEGGCQPGQQTTMGGGLLWAHLCLPGNMELHKPTGKAEKKKGKTTAGGVRGGETWGWRPRPRWGRKHQPGRGRARESEGPRPPRSRVASPQLSPLGDRGPEDRMTGPGPRRPPPHRFLRGPHPTRRGASRPGPEARGTRDWRTDRPTGRAPGGGGRAWAQPAAATLPRRPDSGATRRGPLCRPRGSYLLFIRKLLLQIRHLSSGDRPWRWRQRPPDFPLSVRSCAPRAPAKGGARRPGCRARAPEPPPPPAGLGARAQRCACAASAVPEGAGMSCLSAAGSSASRV
jgi:hypothetical protein